MLLFFFVSLHHAGYVSIIHFSDVRSSPPVPSPCSRRRHEITRSTHPFSSLLTSSLNACTSFQQSSGRRSFSRRHRTTSLLEISTLSGTSFTNFRVCSFLSSSSISLDALCRLVGVLSGAVSSATLARSEDSRRVSSSCSLRSSVATRAWI